MIIKTCFIFIIISQLQFPQKAFWEKTNFPSKSNVTTFGFNSKNEIYLGTNGKGIFRSSDNGNTWVNIKGKLPSGQVDCILVTKDDELFIGVSCTRSYVIDPHPYGIYFLKKDSSEINISYSALYVWSMAIDTLGNILASTDNYGDFPDVIKLSPRKSEWTGIEQGLPLDMLTKIISDNQGNLYITRYDDGGGLYKSNDSGNNWELVDNELNNVIILNIASDSKGNIVAEFENRGVYLSTDGAKHWSLISKNDNLKNYIRTYGIMFDAKDNLYINYFPNGIFRSNDLGLTWQKLGDDLLDENIWNFSIDLNGFIWIFTSKGGLYRSLISVFN